MTSAISGGPPNAAQLAQFIFKKADANNDGQLTEAELAAAKPADAPSDAPSAADLIKAGDANGDGQLTQSELESALKATRSKLSNDTQSSLLALQDQSANDPLSTLINTLLKALDANKDGKIDKSDIEALKKKQQEAKNQDQSGGSGSANVALTLQTSQSGSGGKTATGYSGGQTTLSILLSYQEAA
jgi:hypothetical protein